MSMTETVEQRLTRLRRIAARHGYRLDFWQTNPALRPKVKFIKIVDLKDGQELSWHTVTPPDRAGHIFPFDDCAVVVRGGGLEPAPVREPDAIPNDGYTANQVERFLKRVDGQAAR